MKSVGKRYTAPWVHFHGPAHIGLPGKSTPAPDKLISETIPQSRSIIVQHFVRAQSALWQFKKPICPRNTAALVENVFQTDFIISHPYTQMLSNLHILLINHILSFIFLVLKIKINLPGVFYNKHFYDEYVSWFAFPLFEPRYQWRYATKIWMSRCNHSFSGIDELRYSYSSEEAVHTPQFKIVMQTAEIVSPRTLPVRRGDVSLWKRCLPLCKPASCFLRMHGALVWWQVRQTRHKEACSWPYTVLRTGISPHPKSQNLFRLRLPDF